MKSNLRIVLLEDSVVDFELIAHELLRDGFSFSLARVQTEAEFRHELEIAPPDLILADHGLPEFDGFAALELVRKLHPQVPFIFVSGSNDQQMVCEMYEKGATDYVFKRDIKDLQAAIQNALEPLPVAFEPPQLLLTLEPKTNCSSLSEPSDSALLSTDLTSPTGHLWLCPYCHQSRDETGQVVPLQDYCDRRNECHVIRKVCANCSPLT